MDKEKIEPKAIGFSIIKHKEVTSICLSCKNNPHKEGGTCTGNIDKKGHLRWLPDVLPQRVAVNECFNFYEKK